MGGRLRGAGGRVLARGQRERREEQGEEVAVRAHSVKMAPPDPRLKADGPAGAAAAAPAPGGVRYDGGRSPYTMPCRSGPASATAAATVKTIPAVIAIACAYVTCVAASACRYPTVPATSMPHW